MMVQQLTTKVPREGEKYHSHGKQLLPISECFQYLEHSQNP